MKHLRILSFLLLLSSLLFTACKKDEANSGISGTLTDSNGDALSGVTVTVYDLDGAEIASTSSEADGSYYLEGTSNGSIEFIKLAYRSIEETLNGEEEQTINASLQDDAFVSSYFGTANNLVDTSANIFQSNSILPASSVNFGTQAVLNNSWFVSTNFKGALDPNGRAWYDGWSFYSRIVAGNTTSAALPSSRPVQTISDSLLQNAADSVYWSNDTTYVLDGFVFVGDGQTLFIEKGTIIQGKAGSGADASALIVARGGKLMAEGTDAEPIIFTFEGDQGGTAATERARWGGLIVLGKASLNSTPGETQIEGIPSSESRGLYGGTLDNDNSGVIRYVSIRHGGSNIGADNEINGLTLGGVGNGTTIEYVEIIGNKDDGIEWFGGTVDAKYLISAFCADDALDYDEGYRGRNQFVIVHQNENPNDDADRGGEHDGGTNPETATPYATPIFANATFVGNPNSRAITFRDNAGGQYYNSIFSGFDRGIDIEDLIGQEQDSYKQWQDGNLKIEGCFFHNINASNIFRTSN